jgi:hypothetical protein
MEMFDDPSWRWGLSLIALTMAFHAAAETELVKSKQRSSTQLGGKPAGKATTRLIRRQARHHSSRVRAALRAHSARPDALDDATGEIGAIRHSERTTLRSLSFAFELPVGDLTDDILIYIKFCATSGLIS